MFYNLERIHVGFEVVGQTVVISSKFSEKDEVKSWGAKWSPEKKVWYFSLEHFVLLFKFLNETYIFVDSPEPPYFNIPPKTFAHKNKPLVFREVDDDVTPVVEALVAPFEFKDELKELGFWWNANKKVWYYPDVDVFFYMFSDYIVQVQDDKLLDLDNFF